MILYMSLFPDDGENLTNVSLLHFLNKQDYHIELDDYIFVKHIITFDKYFITWSYPRDRL